jgi:hypothetical protein
MDAVREHEIAHELSAIWELCHRSLKNEERIIRLLERLLHPQPQNFTLEITMIGNIVAGASGSFALALLLNGVADTTDPVSAVTWSSPDPTVTVEPSADGLSAVFTVPASDVATTLVANATGTVTIAAGSPSTLAVGSTQSASGSASVPVSPAATPQVFTLSIIQTA